MASRGNVPALGTGSRISGAPVLQAGHWAAVSWGAGVVPWELSHGELSHYSPSCIRELPSAWCAPAGAAEGGRHAAAWGLLWRFSRAFRGKEPIEVIPIVTLSSGH